jgi:predicted phosphodiesterase
MKFHILSDLHLEFDDLDLPRTDADVVVLAGDIALGTDGVRFAARRFRHQPVVYVLGNHEYYHRRMNEVWDDIRQYPAPHVHVLENQSVTIGGVRFLGCTLWTDFLLFGPDRLTASLEAARTYMADFKVIRDHQGNMFTPEASMEMHARSRAFLASELAKPHSGPTVVVTHHLPCWESIALKYRDDELTPAFASDLSDLMGKADLWIHGHGHSPVDCHVGGTRVLANPRGYCHYERNENPKFDPGFVVELTA